MVEAGPDKLNICPDDKPRRHCEVIKHLKPLLVSDVRIWRIKVFQTACEGGVVVADAPVADLACNQGNGVTEFLPEIDGRQIVGVATFDPWKLQRRVDRRSALPPYSKPCAPSPVGIPW